MDNIWSIRTLTTAMNNMESPDMRIFNKFFRPKLNMQPSSRLAFEVISGNNTVLGNISVTAPATVGSKTGRKVITLEAPRLAEKRIIHTAEVNNMRAYGEQFGLEMLKTRIAREMRDMRDKFDRTLEFWAAYALRGKIYDSDLTTILVDYNIDSDHVPTISGNDLWSAYTTASPVTAIRAWKRLIEEDCAAPIRSWHAFCSGQVMDALLKNDEVIDLMKTQRGVQIAENGKITYLAGVTIEEYSASFIDDTGTRKYFIEPGDFMLIGETADGFDCPYAPIVDEAAPGGVGNMVGGKPALFFSKSWSEQDPSGRWIKGESRPLPVVQRPEAIVRATVINS